MSNYRHTTTSTNFIQADSPVTIPVNNQSELFQVTSFAASNVGTLTFRIQVAPEAPFETLTDIDTGVIETIDLSTDIRSWQMKGYIVNLEVTSVGLVGTGTVIIQSGDD